MQIKNISQYHVTTINGIRIARGQTVEITPEQFKEIEKSDYFASGYYEVIDGKKGK